MDPITIGLAAGGLATSLFGGFQAGQERRNMKSELGKMEAENKAFYNNQALSDYTQREDSQNVLRQMRNQLDRQTKRTANTQAITGGTVEQTAVQKDAANKALADATANIGAIGSQFKDRVTDRYINRKNHISMMKMNLADQSAQGWEGLMQTGLNTSAGALSSIVPGSAGAGGASTPGNVGASARSSVSSGRIGGGSSSSSGKIGNVSTQATSSPVKSVSGIIPKYKKPNFNR